MTHTGSEIREALAALHAESVRYWQEFDSASFLAPIGDAWSPAGNVRHLTKAMRAVTKGLQLPRIFLLLAFFAPRRPSRSFDGMRDVYRARLAEGASAGPFAPGPRVTTTDPGSERAQIMTDHAVAVEALSRAIAAWPEPLLDRRHLPHPLLGKLTVREMLFFTLYHNQHHVDTVRRRVRAASTSARP